MVVVVAVGSVVVVVVVVVISVVVGNSGLGVNTDPPYCVISSAAGATGEYFMVDVIVE